MKRKTRRIRESSRAGVTDRLTTKPMKRRAFMGTMATAMGAAAASSLGACHEGHKPNPAYDQPPTTAPEGKELRTIHFDLSLSKVDDEHYCQVFQKRYQLFRHTRRTLRMLSRKSDALAAFVKERPPTHYSQGLPFPKDFLQSLSIYRTSDSHVIPQLALATIHVPEAALKRHWERVRAGVEQPMHPDKLRVAAGQSATAADGGGGDPDAPILPDFDDFKDLMDQHQVADAATWVTFQHPDIMSLDADQATTIMSYLQGSPAFQSLELEILTLGAATTPDESGEYTGWVNGFYQTGPAVAPINGEQVYTTTGEAMWFTQSAPEVVTAAGPVAISALNAIRNNDDMNGSRYGIDSGEHADDVTADPSMAAQPKALVLQGSCEGSTIHHFDHQDQWRNGAKITMDSTSTDKLVKFTVHNSYFLFRGCYVGFRDAAGDLIKLEDIADDFTIDGEPYDPGSACSDYFAWLGSVDDIFRVLGIPLESEESRSWEVTIPEAATTIEVFTGTASTHFTSDFTALKSETYHGLEFHGAMTTSLVDMTVPGLGLIAGIGGGILANLKNEVAALLVEFLGFVVQTLTGTIAASEADSERSWDNIIDIVMWFATQTASTLAEAFPQFDEALLSGITTIWSKITKSVAEAAAESEAEESVPVIGNALRALDIAGSIAEIAETSVDIAKSSKIMSWKANRVHDVKFVIDHDENDTQFPAVSTHMLAVLQLPNAQTLTQTRQLTETDVQVAQMEVEFCGVPEGGTANFTVTYFSANDWVAGVGSIDFDNVTPGGDDEQVVGVRIDERQVPLTPDTTYSSVERLDWASDQRDWIDDTTGPAGTLVAQDCGAGGNRLCQPESITVSSRYGQLGYTWQSTGTAILGCAGGGQNAQLYQAQNVSFSGDIDSGNPESVLMQTSCGSTAPTFVGYDITGDADGNHFFLDASTGTYHLRKIALAKDGSYQTLSYGAFAAKQVKSFAIHPGSYACALNANGGKLEVLELPDVPFENDDDAWQATQVSGPGTQVGTILGAVSLAPTANGSSFLVLENVNQRIQCFSRFGNPVMDFFDNPDGPNGKSSWTPLHAATSSTTYLDIGVESGGYVYVLGHDGPGTQVSEYFLDIYLPSGGWLSRTTGFAAARMTVDLWRSVWSMDWASYITAQGNTEPIIRRWIPSTPPPA